MRGIVIGVIRDTNSDSDTYSPMMQACYRGLGVLVREVLTAREAVVGPLQRWIDHADPNGRTPLYCACIEGRAQVVALLLDKGRDTLDVNRATTGGSNPGSTPLMEACARGYTEIAA